MAIAASLPCLGIMTSPRGSVAYHPRPNQLSEMEVSLMDWDRHGTDRVLGTALVMPDDMLASARRSRLEASLPPPLVLSGHAASLTPY